MKSRADRLKKHKKKGILSGEILILNAKYRSFDMKKCAVLLFVLSFFAIAARSSAAPVPLLRMPGGNKITCEGFWSGHLQGICSDGKNRIY